VATAVAMVAGAIDLRRGAVARELPRRLRIVPLSSGCGGVVQHVARNDTTATKYCEFAELRKTSSWRSIALFAVQNKTERQTDR
jgi:hypothetical protein